MEQVPLPPRPDSSQSPLTDDHACQSTEQLADLENPEKQAAYRREYLKQLQRRACPGCGEADSIY